jgi:hypothetical protein
MKLMVGYEGGCSRKQRLKRKRERMVKVKPRTLTRGGKAKRGGGGVLLEVSVLKGLGNKDGSKKNVFEHRVEKTEVLRECEMDTAHVILRVRLTPSGLIFVFFSSRRH